MTTRRRTLALAATWLFTLAGGAPPAHAQAAAKPVADTGVVSLGPGQLLRITVVSGATADASVRFRRIEYFQGGCNASVCTLTAGPQAAPDAVTVRPGEGATLDIRGGPAGVRGIVTSESRGLRVTIQVVDAQTNQIIAILIG
jgi:hypothetical protein